jgi:hypothetical protein
MAKATLDRLALRMRILDDEQAHCMRRDGSVLDEGDASADRPLNLSEGAYFDLADTLARHAKLDG